MNTTVFILMQAPPTLSAVEFKIRCGCPRGIEYVLCDVISFGLLDKMLSGRRALKEVVFEFKGFDGVEPCPRKVSRNYLEQICPALHARKLLVMHG